jgi:hypothetical protein
MRIYQRSLIDASGGYNTRFTLKNMGRDGGEAHIETEGLPDA